LLDKTDGTTAGYAIVENIEPGDWIRGPDKVYGSEIRFTGVSAGEYDLGVAIVDTTLGDKPAIQLAIDGPKSAEGWYDIGENPSTVASSCMEEEFDGTFMGKSDACRDYDRSGRGNVVPAANRGRARRPA